MRGHTYIKFEVCPLHVGQCWWRNMQYLGLDKRYGQKDSKISQFFAENILDRIHKQRRSETVVL